MQTESQIIAHFKQLDHEEMLDMIELDELGASSTQLFTDEDNILHTFYSASDDYFAFNESVQDIELRRGKLIEIYKKTLH